MRSVMIGFAVKHTPRLKPKVFTVKKWATPGGAARATIFLTLLHFRCGGFLGCIEK